MKYEIIQKLRWSCRVIDVKLKKNRSDESKFVVVKFGKYDNGEFLRSVILNKFTYDGVLHELQTKTRHTIERVAIRPQNNVYHILQWDDVDRGICTREHIYEVQRDDEGIPMMFNQIVVYANLDGKNHFTIDNVLDKEYIDVNSPLAQNHLNFNNRMHYLLEQKSKEEQAYNQMMDAFYEANESKRCLDMYMTEEERVMLALENGEGELYGF